MDLAQQLFHLVTVKDYIYTPDAGLRGAATDEASDERWIGRMGKRLSFGGKTVADLGCGGGTLCVRAAREGATSVVGVDLDIEVARRTVDEAGPEATDRIELLRTDGDLTELGDRQFDLVTSKDSMEHFPDPEAFIDLVVPLVRPGGEFAVGFSPLWKSPKGGHLDYMTKLPWAHLLFPERVIMAERRRFRPDEDAAAFSEIRGGLNKMTLERFDRIMAGTGLEPIYLSTDPGDRPVLRAMRRVARIRPLREYFTVGVYSIWRKPEGNT